MDVFELGAIGELVGGLAVVGSLIYVGIQVRQNNRNLEANSEAVMASTEIAGGEQVLRAQIPVAQTPELAQVLLEGAADYEALTSVDKVRYSAFWTAALISHQGYFLHHDRGYISEISWDSYSRQFDIGVQRPGFGQWWERSRNLFHPMFQDYIEAKRSPSRPEGSPRPD